MTKVKVEFRVGEYRTLENRIMAIKPSIDRIAKELLDCKIDLTAINLQDLVADSKKVMRAHAPDDFQKVAKYVNPATLQYPTEFNDVIHVVEDEKMKYPDLPRYVDYYSITGAGVVALIKEKLDDLKEACTVYANNEKELARYELAQKLARILNEYQEKARALNVEIFSPYEGHASYSRLLPRIVELSNETFTPKFTFVKNGN